MHFRLIVTTNLDNAKNSKEARQYVKSELENDSSFVGEGGRFSSPIADWFLIGGRWSGALQVEANDKFNEESKSIFKDSNFVSTKEVEENKDKLQELWEKVGGKGLNPYNRDSYLDDGYEDDAMILDSTLYDKFIKKYEGEWGQGEDTRTSQDQKYTWKELHFIDLEEDEVNSNNYVNKKWAVVVDYHN